MLARLPMSVHVLPLVQGCSPARTMVELDVLVQELVQVYSLVLVLVYILGLVQELVQELAQEHKRLDCW